ncbi:MAG: flagellar biosynthetic protein FliO [Leptospira sp.]|jgi:flagellar protein FliO/FliZ|nr:flagellar biosynthetic protein FliO [Leptospira sp.]
MIHPNKYILKTDRQLMYFFYLVLIFISTSLFSQGANTKELDQILRNELGQTSNKQQSEGESRVEKRTSSDASESNSKNSESSRSDLEVNPIKERYTDVNEDSPSATWVLLKILFVLCILVGAGYYLVLQMQKTKSARYPVKGFMKVLSHLPLSQTQSLQVVEVGGKLLVLGVADGSINLVSEITSPEEKANILKQKDEADPYVPNFLETLMESLQSKAQRKIRINKNSLEMSDDPLGFDIQAKAKEGLERLRKHREMLEGGGAS